MSDTKEQREQARKAWREQEALAIETAKVALAGEYCLDRDEKFEIAWNIAWSYGHSSGINEVKNYLGELVPLLKP